MIQELDDRSMTRMRGVHPDLIRVVLKANDVFQTQHPGLSFFVTEGLRSLDRQRELLAKGASKTLNSRHLTGHAVDLAVRLDGELRWDWPLYGKLGVSVKGVAVGLGVSVVWGGDWRNFRDGPHFELDRRAYPA